MGKGSRPRPRSISQKQWAERWDRIFSGPRLIKEILPDHPETPEDEQRVKEWFSKSSPSYVVGGDGDVAAVDPGGQAGKLRRPYEKPIMTIICGRMFAYRRWCNLPPGHEGPCGVEEKKL